MLLLNLLELKLGPILLILDTKCFSAKLMPPDDATPECSCDTLQCLMHQCASPTDGGIEIAAGLCLAITKEAALSLNEANELFRSVDVQRFQLAAQLAFQRRSVR